MSERNTGGSAFPLPIAVGPTGDVYHAAAWAEGGMTLRDYFAAQALNGLIPDCGLTALEMAERCFDAADAMLTIRETGPVEAFIAAVKLLEDSGWKVVRPERDTRLDPSNDEDGRPSVVRT